MTNLTQNEADLMEAIANSNFGDDLCDTLWTFDVSDNFGGGKRFSGTVSSLTEKGLIGSYKVTAKERRMGDEDTIWMTKAGAEAMSTYFTETGRAKPRRLTDWEAENEENE